LTDEEWRAELIRRFDARIARAKARMVEVKRMERHLGHLHAMAMLLARGCRKHRRFDESRENVARAKRVREIGSALAWYS
jgi:hypothetical protein